MASYVLTFKDYEPAAKLDGAPWTQIQILEGAQEAGPFTLIDTQQISPVDANPAQPQARSFTTKNATMQSGWYQVVFLDDSGAQTTADAVYNDAARDDFMPGVGDVGAQLRSRTKDSSGNEVGTFTAATRPTRDQVERLIEQAAPRVLNKLGSRTPEPLWAQISNVIAIAAALRVELSFFPEQVAANRSPYNELKALRDEELADLLVALEMFGAESGDEDPHAPADLPAFGFPSRQLRAAGAEETFPGWPYGPDPWDRPLRPLWRDW